MLTEIEKIRKEHLENLISLGRFSEFRGELMLWMFYQLWERDKTCSILHYSMDTSDLWSNKLFLLN